MHNTTKTNAELPQTMGSTFNNKSTTTEPQKLCIFLMFRIFYISGGCILGNIKNMKPVHIAQVSYFFLYPWWLYISKFRNIKGEYGRFLVLHVSITWHKFTIT